jgi:hypothetical protein
MTQTLAARAQDGMPARRLPFGMVLIAMMLIADTASVVAVMLTA